MKPITVLISLIACVCSCKQNAVDLSKIDKVKWQVADSTTRYFISKTSSEKLESTDSITISFIGILNDQNLVSNSRIDSLACTQLLNLNFGTYLLSDKEVNKRFEIIISHLSKNAEAFVKYQQDTTSLSNKLKNNRMSVYFKDNFDSLSAVRWLQKLNSAGYIDSSKYISKDEALKAFRKDESWKPVLDVNPLPSFAEVYIKTIYCNQKSMDSIRASLINYKFIEEVTFSDFTIGKEMEAFRAVFRTPFILKFKT